MLINPTINEINNLFNIHHINEEISEIIANALVQTI